MRYKDEFDDDPQSADILAGILKAIDIREKLRPRSPLFGGLILGSTVLLLVGLLWYSYPKEAAKQEMKAVPIVKAEAGPMKIVPTDPGGMDIPYRESTVFDTLRAQNAAETGGRIENLLPEQEQPMPRNELFAGAKTDLKTDTTSASVVEKPAETAAPAPEPEKIAAVEEKPAPAKPADKTVAEKVAKTEPAAGNAKDSSYVQLGSLRSRADAEKAWKDGQSSFPAQLGSVALRIQEADLGAKGTFYRAQGGPLSEDKAQAICKAITAKKPGGCLVVRN
jgi:hypothetical protein